jgi:hypothetical protein
MTTHEKSTSQPSHQVPEKADKLGALPDDARGLSHAKGQS